MTGHMPSVQSISEFLFGAPLYAEYQVGMPIVEILYQRTGETNRVDGHCPYCNKPTTYTIHGQSVPSGQPWNDIGVRVAYDFMQIVCARNENHRVRYWFLMRKMHVQKVGQYPSLADIANDEVAGYRAGMKKQDGEEFHKAIGLAAHGVGVGSFVYLRRVFERLIYSRFEEFKDAEGWNKDEFYKSAMADKVKFLKGHLPEFLVENAKVYSILSVGIHELDEKSCLEYFDLMKSSIIMILEEDKKLKEELGLKAKVAKAIAGILPKSADAT